MPRHTKSTFSGRPEAVLEESIRRIRCAYFVESAFIIVNIEEKSLFSANVRKKEVFTIRLTVKKAPLQLCDCCSGAIGRIMLCNKSLSPAYSSRSLGIATMRSLLSRINERMLLRSGVSSTSASTRWRALNTEVPV